MRILGATIRSGGILPPQHQVGILMARVLVPNNT